MSGARHGRPGIWRGTGGLGIRRYLVAYGVSRLGDKLYNVAQVVVVLRLTGSPGWVAAVLVAHNLPYVLVKPIGGVLVDRVDRRRLLLGCDLARLALQVVFGLLVLVRGPVAAILLVVFLTTAVGAPSTSALSVSLAERTPENRLAVTNAALGALGYVAVVAGPLVAGVVLLLLPDWVPFLVNAATFLASALLIGSVPPLARPASAASSGPVHATPRESYRTALAAGARLVFGDVVVRGVLLLQGGGQFVLGLGQVLLALVGRDLLGTGEEGLGWLTAATGIGGVLGVAIAARAARQSRVLAVIGAAGVVAALPTALLGTLASPWPAYVLLAFGGLGFVTIDVVMLTALQRAVDRRSLGRVDGLVSAVGYAALMAGSLVGVPLSALLGLRGALAVGAGLVVLLGLVVLVRHRDLTLAALAPDVLVVLRRVPSLRGLDEPVLEALAAAAGAEETLAAGTIMLEAGDRAEEVLVLVRGEADVFATTLNGVALPERRLVNQVSGPEIIGEIGVLQRRPRTATVVATTPVAVRRIAAADFEAALLPGADLGGVGTAMTTRLARWAG